ncbi:hypothetical protein [Paraburkholderia caribensis]|uniref:hypothetical protein n=1 Tax=Paraburkholderia caribensis TaxID=75105 RepID=UPI00209193C1|nr:hypothetical protein [Paraburkholderia caribensis]MCO4880231.1 hypothetical protein [Paraburkholderia caribensis]
MKLHFGVIDQQYRNGQSTGEVATILEKKYDVMGTFAAHSTSDIKDALTNSIGDAVQAIMSGQPVPADPFAEGTDEIQEKFRRFLDTNAHGIVTDASKQGVSGRFKDKYNRQGKRGQAPGLSSGQVRPSFIDTGLYQNSFKAWVEE